MNLLAPEIALIALITGMFLFTWFAGPPEYGRMRPPAKSEARLRRLAHKPARGTMNYVSIAALAAVFIPLAALWRAPGSAFHGAFRLDSLALFFKALFLISAAAALIMAQESIKTLSDRTDDFAILIVTATLGAFFLASAGDLVTLFIAIEWMTISLYVLTAYVHTDRYSLEAGTKYLIMGAFSSALFLYGISFVYGTAGSVEFDQIRTAFDSAQEKPLLTLGLLFILAGIGFKVGAFPFQLWIPDVYEGAPTPIAAFLSVSSKTAGFAALVKILFQAVGLEHFNWPVLLSALSAATLLYGNLGALGQTNMKRLFAYSSIGHAGYLLIGISSGSLAGVEAVLFYLAAYGLSNLAAFLVIVIANRELGSGKIADYRGLSKKAPFLAGAFFIALLSLGGIPPLAGFFGKFLVIQAVLQKGYVWLAFLGAVNVIISLYYYLSIVKEMYFKPAVKGPKIELGIYARAALILLSIGIIGIGSFQQPILSLAKTAAETLF